jgi:hypothetical protein
MNVSEEIKSICDKKIDHLFSDKNWEKQKKKKEASGSVDDIFTETDARTKYILHTATIMHGQCVEDIYLEAIKLLCDDLEVWEEKKFKVSKHALDISTDQANKDVMKYELEYGDVAIIKKKKKTTQIDILTYNKNNKEISSYEVKRAGSHHDRQKKEKIIADIVATKILLKSYGEQRGLEIKSTRSFIIAHMNVQLLTPEWIKLQIYGKDLDEHFDEPISYQIKQGLEYFKNTYRSKLKKYLELAYKF